MRPPASLQRQRHRRCIRTASPAPGTCRIADGSTVTLDASSLVCLPPWTTRRDLDLMQGRAIFKAAHDKARPFTVRTPGYAVVATRTKFAMKRSPVGVRVTLVERHVRVTGDGGGGAIVLDRSY